MWEGGSRGSSPRQGSLSSRSVRNGSSSINSSNDNQFYANDIREKVATLSIELHDKTQTIELLHAARKKDKAKATENASLAAAEFQAKLQVLQDRHEKELEKQLDFAQTLVADKVWMATYKHICAEMEYVQGELVQRCDNVAAELKKAVDRLQQQDEGFQRQLKDAKERWSVQEKVRRDQWVGVNITIHWKSCGWYLPI
ncbi:hypothetical protein DYB28_013399 [Aphanomyces astaci]|uniref:Uncharacterized protein n=1 Tax=Aphanomyces astaci TaxID=112090 RepID=A0A9X8E6W1_APHAT|nr:hypothetical protein DYB28_013399 [Aphanomyces astaci]